MKKRYNELIKKLFRNRYIDSDFSNFSKDIKKYFDDMESNMSYSYKSPDGNFYFKETYYNDFSYKENEVSIESLEIKLNKLVEEEKFEEASTVRDLINGLKNNSDKVKELNKELEKVIKEQNFERAIEIRDELKKI
jgi:protein-arginine kinase activator protein McsA